MRTVNLAEDPLDLAAVLHVAGQEPVWLLTPDGKALVLTEADDFEREVEGLRRSSTLQHFLEERSKAQRRIPLEAVEREIEQDLSKGEPASPQDEPDWYSTALHTSRFSSAFGRRYEMGACICAGSKQYDPKKEL